MEIINIGISYRMAELLISVSINFNDLPSLDKLATTPSVALLYVTYNDTMLELLPRLRNQTYKILDIFVLDDSDIDGIKEKIDQIGYIVIRRKNRKGFKAGALNNWLLNYGSKYDYFIIADSDSMFDEDFVERMVKYAEHPLNKNISIFQSKILIWNTKNKFSRIISIMSPVSNYIVGKLYNEISASLSMGHNNLHRTRNILDIGGFLEDFLAEDFATSLKLIDHGYECKYVDVISYEMMPETIKGFINREIRWARQSIELANIDADNMPFGTKLHLLITIYHYAIWPIYFLGIFIILFSYSSSADDVRYLLDSLVNGKFQGEIFLKQFILLSIYMIILPFIRLPLALKLKISIKQYFENFLLSAAIGYYMMFFITKELIKSIIGFKPTFDVTDKLRARNISLYILINEFKYQNLFIILILFGIFKNPLAFVFNFVWLSPVIMSPIIIYLLLKN